MTTLSKFIVVEGVDGSGKSTVARYIVAALRQTSRSVAYEYEPTTVGTGKRIHAILRGEESVPPTPIFAAMFALDRYHHTQLIKEYLADGTTVVCDRYIWSNLVYQGQDNPDMHDLIRHLHAGFYLAPDMFIYLNVRPAVAAERVGMREDIKSMYDHFERINDHHRFYHNLLAGLLSPKPLALFKPETFIAHVDANQPLEDMLKQVDIKLCQFDAIGS